MSANIPHGECLTPSAALTFFLGKRRCSAAEAESAFAVGKYDCRGAAISKHRGSKRSLRGCLRQPFSHLCGGRLKKLFEKSFLKIFKNFWAYFICQSELQPNRVRTRSAFRWYRSFLLCSAFLRLFCARGRGRLCGGRRRGGSSLCRQQRRRFLRH